MNKNKYCVIMAGGVGSRFWPISRSTMPKQFLDILGVGKTFIRMTFERFAEFIPSENFYVVTNAIYKDLVLEQLPELSENQVLLEPVGRNTAPCIAYAAFKIKTLNPDAQMIVTPADHLVLMQKEFVEAMKEGLQFTQQHDALMTIGIKPSRPDTGYGYIQVGSDERISPVKIFTEKPGLEMAEVFVQSGEFMWNAGIFIWRVDAVLKALQLYQSEIYAMFDSISEAYNTSLEQEAINKIYPECRSISIDFGVMEKAQNVYVRCSEFGWSDIGTWVSLYQHSLRDESENVAGEGVKLYDTTNCIVKPQKDKLTVIQGLDDFIVVDTEDVLMICPKKNEQNVKQFIDDLRYQDLKKYI